MIVVNNCYQIAPWADGVYAMDSCWWRKYYDDVCDKFEGFRYSVQTLKGVNRAPIKHHGNSGAGAIALAECFGAKKIYLLGYDCKVTNGKKHWHGDHEKGLGNAGSMHKWPQMFAKVATTISSEVINLSRDTALNCFKRGRLEDYIDG